MDFSREALRRPPPVVDDDDLFADPPKSFLLDYMPFIGDRTNATTAHGIFSDPFTDEPKAGIRASLFISRPPRVSYVVLDCVNTRFTEEPLVAASNGGFVLLSIDVGISPSREYYMYQPGHGGGAPLLDRIMQPNGGTRLVDRHLMVGLLASPGGGYHIAALTMVARGKFELHVFSSETRGWTVKKPFLPPDAACLAEDKDLNYLVDKPIPLGDSVVAFVDLFNGILICDVLHGGDCPELLHVPLPSTAPRLKPTICSQPLIPCDVAIDMSGDIIRIKYIQVVYCLDTSPWHATTWITSFKAATRPWRRLHDWEIQYQLFDPSMLSVRRGISLAGLLRDEPYDVNPTLDSLFVDSPLLSLHEDGVVSFIAKSSFQEIRKWVMVVDLGKNELQGAVPLPARRYTRLYYTTINTVAAPTDTDHKTNKKKKNKKKKKKKQQSW